MRLTLKNVKIANSFSEETTAFTATVHIDGAKVASVRNDGRGGSHFFRPEPGQRETLDKAQETAKAALTEAGEENPFEALDRFVDHLIEVSAVRSWGLKIRRHGQCDTPHIYLRGNTFNLAAQDMQGDDIQWCMPLDEFLSNTVEVSAESARRFGLTLDLGRV